MGLHLSKDESQNPIVVTQDNTREFPDYHSLNNTDGYPLIMSSDVDEYSPCISSTEYPCTPLTVSTNVSKRRYLNVKKKKRYENHRYNLDDLWLKLKTKKNTIMSTPNYVLYKRCVVMSYQDADNGAVCGPKKIPPCKGLKYATKHVASNDVPLAPKHKVYSYVHNKKLKNAFSTLFHLPMYSYSLLTVNNGFYKASTSDIRDKHRDASAYLFRKLRNDPHEVSASMLLNVVGPKTQSLLICTQPSDRSQKDFEDKNISVTGTLAAEYHPGQYGIGYACKKGMKPLSPNQDDFFILKVNDWCLCGVFDGHGVHGHRVSHFIHLVLPYIILTDPLFEEDPLGVIEKAFPKAHCILDELSRSCVIDIDCRLSGTTGTVFLRRADKVIIAHVGDSRAVLCNQKNHSWKSLDLTLDHKPVEYAELRRIQMSGGEVRRLRGDIPFRVFVKNKTYPGLAMSRAIGDTVGTCVGIIPHPQVKMFSLKRENKFIVMSSDGVWEFMSSDAALRVVCQNDMNQAQEAANVLAAESWRQWVNEEDNVVDDITCIIFWLNS